MAIEVVQAPTKLQRELFLQIGKRRYHIADIRDAVAKHNATRDASGLGASEMPRVTIVSNTGQHVYGISYNGRVWDGVNEVTDF